MKLISSLLTIILGATVLLLATGCHTVSSYYGRYNGVKELPPSDAMQVQILRTEPTRPHIRLGEAVAPAKSENVDVTSIETALKKGAAELGADAAVVVYDKTQSVGAQVVGGWVNRSGDPIEGRIAIAVAIKYQ